jgi:hypothetical protein
MRHTKRILTCLGIMVAMILSSAPSGMADQAAHGGKHKQLSGVITKIESGMVFVKVEGMPARTISISKADRMGLHEARVGDPVTFTVDENNVVVDVHKAGVEPAGHRRVTGKLHIADPSGSEIKLATQQGVETFSVDSMAASKLAGLAKGAPVVLELDESNTVIDIHPGK